MKKCEIMQCNNYPNLYVASPGKQQLQNNNMVDLMMMPYIMLQEATTTAMTVRCNKHAISHKQQPPFSLIWINHINHCKGTKHQQ
jgi:hypothetical protein